MRIQLTSLLGLAAVVLLPTLNNPLQAQVPAEQRSVLAFDVYLDRISSSDLAKSTGMDAPNGPMSGNSDNPIQADDVRRVFGAVSAPASLQSLQTAGKGVEPLDFSFFARLQFKDQNAADKAFTKMSEGAVPADVGDKKCLRPPPGPTVPSNVAFYRLSPDVVEFGTDDYLALADRNVFSDNLMEAWKKMPKAAIRVAADLDGARHLVDEGIQMAGGSIPPMAQPAISMVNNMSVLRIGLDFSGDTLLWLTATGKDESATGQINNTLGGLLAMAKGIGAQSLPMAGPDAKGPGEELLAALSTTVDGNDVNLVLPHPDGLDKAIGGVMMQAMSMGGPPQDMEAEMMQPGATPKADPFGGDGADPFGGDDEEMSPAEAAASAAGDDPFGGDGGDPFGN